MKGNLFGTQEEFNTWMMELEDSRKEMLKKDEEHGLQGAIKQAVCWGEVERVEEFLREDIDVNFVYTYDRNMTLLMYATSVSRNEEIIKLLISFGANIWAKNEKGETAYELSAYQFEDNEEILILLGKMTRDAFLKAVEENDLSTIEYLLNSGVDVDAYLDVVNSSALIIAAEDGNKGMVEFLLKHGANPLHINRRKETALLECIGYHFDFELFKMLVEAGSDIHHRSEHPSQNIFTECAGKGVDVMEYLIEKGANCLELGQYGMSALTIAAATGTNKEIDYLFSLGLNVNHVDELGKTPLMWAIANKKGTLKALLKHGANANFADKDGWTALKWAERNSGTDVNIERLKRAMKSS